MYGRSSSKNEAKVGEVSRFESRVPKTNTIGMFVHFFHLQYNSARLVDSLGKGANVLSTNRNQSQQEHNGRNAFLTRARRRTERTTDKPSQGTTSIERFVRSLGFLSLSLVP